MGNELNIGKELAHQYTRISALEIEMGDYMGVFNRDAYKNGVDVGLELGRQMDRIFKLESKLGDRADVSRECSNVASHVDTLHINECRIRFLEKKLNIDKIKNRVKNFVNNK